MHPSVFLVALPLALASHLRISIPPSTVLPNAAILPPSTTATLTTLSKVYTAPLRADSTFDFRNVSSGSYLLDVHCHTYGFAPLRVDVLESIQQEQGDEVVVCGTFRGNEWGNKGEVISVSSVVPGEKIWGFGVKAVGPKEYLIQRQGCEFKFSSGWLLPAASGCVC